MILTFYSFKGGVGRSMALANMGDLFARQGLRVLMIDFDLEAPGLEQYFPVDQKDIHGRLGLLDLILRYKHAMSLGSGRAGENAEFRKLRELFIASIYDQLPAGGRLDLLPAGQRGTDEDLSRYALALRTFDWQDFYFNWAGELFFEWLRRTLVPELYDVVLVDSRTGVTEMGGICAYQLADVLVVLCAPNHQSVEGTSNVVRNLFSDRVRELRRNRPLEVVIVPARVELRDSTRVQVFRDRFEQAFAIMTPAPLKERGMSFWDLLIPYDAQYALEEQVITDPERAAERQRVAGAYRRLAEAITLVVKPQLRLRGKPLEALAPLTAVEPQYDVTRRFAKYDVFLSHSATDKPAVEELARRLQRAGITPFLDKWHLAPGEPWLEVIERAVEQSQSCAVFLGPGEMGPWQNEEVRVVLDGLALSGVRIIPVLLPGAEFNVNKLPRFLRHVTWVDFRTGLDDPEALRRLVAGIRGEAPGPAPQVEVEQGSPFPGLRSFAEADAAFFFGRRQLVGLMLEVLYKRCLLMVIGASGSGKSSVVNAGLLPALRGGFLSPIGWRFLQFRVGIHPLEDLAVALGQLVEEGSNKSAFGIRNGLLNGVSLPVIIGESGFDLSSSKLVLVCDQFEELWTISSAPEERSLLIRLLLEAADSSSGSLLVIIILRSDFLPRVAEHRELAAALGEHVVLVGPMTQEELREAIEGPTRVAGLAFEPGLADRILDDVVGQPGALPLLQFALFELWNARKRGFLTFEAYQSMGGVARALGSRAEVVFERYEVRQQDRIRQLLLRLVQPGEGGNDTRRRVLLNEVIPAEGTLESIEALIQPMVESRLLTITFDPATGSYVEISHEALLHGWPRLRAWIEQQREDLRELRRLEEAAREWQAANRSKDFLWRGARILSADRWLEHSRALLLTELEREFLDASRVQLDLEQAARLRRRRRWAIPLVMLLGLTLLTSFLAWSSYIRKQRLEVQARHLSQEAILARRAAVRSNQAAVTTYSPDNRYIFVTLPDGAGEVQDSVTGRRFRNIPRGARITAARFSPDSSVLALGCNNGIIYLWRYGEDVAHVTVLSGERVASVRSLAFSPDGLLLATGGDDGLVRFWDLRSPRLLGLLDTGTNGITSLRFSLDGTELLTVRADGKLLVVEVPRK